MLLKLFQFAQVGNIQFVQAEHGRAINRILAEQVWDALHTYKVAV
jgi:hypothetical protein